jgi:ArsR family transcriptional regulator, arsenate/arsenite/antimonite-responsive transcriptional repressor
MDEEQAVIALGALAHPVRLRVFRALVVSGPRGLVPGVMQEALGIPASTLSFHLKELAIAGLVNAERDSRSLIYRARFERMNGLLDYLTKNCCEGAACLTPTGTAACGC